MTRRALVHRISANAPDDISGIAAAIASKQIDPGAVIAVLAKTEQRPGQRLLARARDACPEPAVPASSSRAAGGANLPGDVGRYRGRYGAALAGVRAPRRREGGGAGACHRPGSHGGAPGRASRPL